MLFTMWLAGNRHNASRCNRDKARRQDCSGRTLVLLPHKHRLVFSLSRNGIRDGKSAMVCQSASRISGPNQSQKADVGSWVNCQIIAARSCNVHPVKVRLAIHHVSHVAAFTEELHYLLSFACHLRPSRFRVGILFQPSENLKSTRFNRRFAAVLIGYFSFG
jgi:hypothetical protein